VESSHNSAATEHVIQWVIIKRLGTVARVRKALNTGDPSVENSRCRWLGGFDSVAP
jgi:hypothetical protein